MVSGAREVSAGRFARIFHEDEAVLEPSLTIRLFGPLEVRVGAESLGRLRSRTVAWTLALLVLRHDRALARDWLAGTLWPDSAAGQASYNLRRALSQLRRALGSEAWRITTPNRHAVSLDLADAEVDLISFDEAIEHGDAESLARAVAVYGGPLLEGCAEEWVLPEREAREQAYVQALERLASGLLARSDAASAITHLRRAVAVEPLRESAHRMLLEALAAQGEYGEAVQRYRALRLLLWDELRTEPSPETRAAYERVREQALGDGRRDLSRTRRTGRHSGMAPGPLPPIWNVPHRRNPSFTGRKGQLSAVAATLGRGGPAALTQAFVGLGGIGKTQLALEYAYRHARDYQAIWWVRAEEPAQLAADYAALAGPLDLPEKGASNQGVTVAAVRAWLERHGDWLLILDNAPGPSDVIGYLPQGGGGHVLITSRDQNWGGVATAVAVPVLPQKEAVAFLERRTGWSGPQVGQLAEELGQLPLALEQAAAYAAGTGCSVTTYLNLLRSHRQALLAREGPSEGYHGTVTTTWGLSIAEAGRECPAADGLLNLCAYLAPDGIPLSMIQDGAEFCPGLLAHAGPNPLLLHDAVAALRRYSLVSVHQDALSVHRLVQAVVRDGLGEEEQRTWAETAARIVLKGLPGEEAPDYRASTARFWPAYDLRLRHALIAASFSAQFSGDDALTAAPDLLSLCGRYLRTRGQYQEARACLTRAVEYGERARGHEHPSVAWSLVALSDFPENPRPLRERAADILQKAGDPGLWWVLVCVARALCAEGDDVGARAPCERAVLALAAEAADSDPIANALVDAYGRLAYLHIRMGDLAGARAAAGRLAVCTERHLAPDHLNQGWARYYLAYVLAQEEDLAGEGRAWERALGIWEAMLEPRDPRIAMALYPLGMYARLGAGDLAGAKACLEQALEIVRQAHGPRHPFAGAILCGLAQVWQFLGEPAAGKPLAEQAVAAAPTMREPWEVLDFAEALMGLRPSARSALTQLASVLLDLGDLEAAEGHLEKALTMTRVVYGEWSGPDHEGIAEVLPTLGRLRRLQGRLDESKAALEQSLAIPEYPGPIHQWRIAATHLEYGLALQAMGDVAGARDHLTQAVAMFERRLGPQHPRTEKARRCLAALDAERAPPIQTRASGNGDAPPGARG